MQRIPSVRPETAQGGARELLEALNQAYGLIPNAAKVMAHSPAVLRGFMGFSAAMGEVAIGPKLHSQVKLLTSETNGCEYCSSILSATAGSAGLSESDILAGRSGHSEERRTKAALSFAIEVLERRGQVSNQDLDRVREAGFGDTEIVEIVASVVLGCFTNFLNKVAETELDVPKAAPLSACKS